MLCGCDHCATTISHTLILVHSLKISVLSVSLCHSFSLCLVLFPPSHISLPLPLPLPGSLFLSHLSLTLSLISPTLTLPHTHTLSLFPLSLTLSLSLSVSLSLSLTHTHTHTPNLHSPQSPLLSPQGQERGRVPGGLGRGPGGVSVHRDAGARRLGALPPRRRVRHARGRAAPPHVPAPRGGESVLRLHHRHVRWKPLC